MEKRLYNNPKKPYVVSIRITDEEMENVRRLMELTNKRAADLMREAFVLLAAQWRLSQAATGKK